MKKLLSATAVFALASCGATQNQKPLEHDLLVTNASIVDVKTGAVIANGFIAVDDGVISVVASDSELARHSAEVMVDAKDGYVIPGLWDMHIHLEGEELVKDNENLLPVYLAYGITTVRDSASDLGNTVIEWRNEINAGKRVGPQIYTAGRKLEGIDSLWKGDLEIANTEDLNKMLDQLDSWGVDFIKITENTLQPDLFHESIQAAKARGYRVSGHVPYGATIDSLAQSGISSIEHASYMLRLGSDEEAMIHQLENSSLSNKEAQQRYATEFDQELAIKNYKKLAANGVAVTPTLIGGRQLAYLKETNHDNDEFLIYLTDRFVGNYEWRINRIKDYTAEQTLSSQERYQLIKAQLPYLQQAGVLLLAGSDSAALNTYVYPAAALHEELSIYQDAGLTPLQVLQTATINGASFMGVDDTQGQLAVGYEADMVILNSNPLTDINATLDIGTVIVNGEALNRDALDAMLQAAAINAQDLDAERAHTHE